MDLKEYYKMLYKKNHKEVYDYLMDNILEIKVHSYRDHSEVKNTISNSNVTLNIKECYNNSALISLGHDFNYELGTLLDIIPMDHAWNSFEDFHFDLTAEIVLDKVFNNYYSIKSFNIDDLNHYLTNIKNIPPMIYDIFPKK